MRQRLIDSLRHPPMPASNATLSDWLVAASGRNDVAEMNKLLDSGAEISASGRMQGMNSLCWGIYQGKLASVNLLLNRGGEECVNLAVESNNNAPIKTRGLTPIMIAASKGDMDMCNLLLQRRASLEVRAPDGVSCLMKACEEGHINVVKHLIERGADYLAVDGRGRSVLDYAVSADHGEIATYLRALDLERKRLERERRLKVRRDKALAPSDRQALLDLFSSTGGANWNRWVGWETNTPDVSAWPGVVVENARVVELRLSHNNLTGELPDALSMLDQLRVLDVSHNNLTGAIPESLVQLRHLKTFLIHDNKYEGPIPPHLAHIATGPGRIPSLLAVFAAAQSTFERVTCRRVIELQLPHAWSTLEKELEHTKEQLCKAHVAQLESIQPVSQDLSESQSLLIEFQNLQKRLRGGDTPMDALVSKRVEVRNRLVSSLRKVVQNGKQWAKNNSSLESDTDLSLVELVECFKDGDQRLTKVLELCAKAGGVGFDMEDNLCNDDIDMTQAVAPTASPSQPQTPPTRQKHNSQNTSTSHKSSAENTTHNSNAQRVRSLAEVALNEISQWRSRHSHKKYSDETDRTALCVFSSFTVSSLVPPDLVRTADAALEAERVFHETDKPEADMPLIAMYAAGRALCEFYSTTAKYLSELHAGLTWAEEEFGRQSAAVSMQYPPSVDELKALLEKQRVREKRRRHLQLEIDCPEPGVDVSALEAQLKQLSSDKVGYHLSSDIMRLRAQLYAIAAREFPELLLPGHPWEKSIADDNIWKSVSNAGLFANGRILGDFENVKEISSRAGKRIYKADDADGNTYALKAFDLGNEQQQRHFLRQVKLLDTLRHPHLCAVSSVFQESGKCYLQMPWYFGGDLEAWLKTPATARNLYTCKQMVRDILLGLAHLHSAGRVHCDVKPANIFLTTGLRCVIGDFDGLQEETREGSNISTRTTFNQATLWYISPEVRDGRSNRFSYPCDVYSLGVVAKEIFTDMVLEADESKLYAEFITQLLQDDPSKRPTAREACLHPFLVNDGVARENQHQCSCCFEIFLESAGVLCTAENAHFTCATCLDGYVMSMATPDELQVANQRKLEQCGGGLCCPITGCVSEPFPAKTVANYVSHETHAAYMHMLRKGTESVLSCQFEKQMRAYKQEVAAQQTIQTARQAEKHIAENILTIKCAKCDLAILDFDGCFSITCGRCQSNICGWCLAAFDRSRDAHEHVKTCEKNLHPGSYYGTLEEFRVLHVSRRKKLLKEYLRTLESGLREAVVDLIIPHAEGVGIMLNKMNR